MTSKTYKAVYLFCGIGGGALGFQKAKRSYRGLEGRFETLVGIDCDPEACEDFRYITGSKAVQMDLFTRKQYTEWHGKEPPVSWREATTEDLMEAAGDVPDIVFTSPPCKGFSALLPAKSAATPKYQALNSLTIRGIELSAKTWRPALILMENVPRITTRGVDFLKGIKEMLSEYGYVFHDDFHDLGELGGLGQKRVRYLLIARLPEKLPAFIYKPAKFRLKGIGDIIGKLPMPGSHGRMHELPKLQWQTWLRLALIPAGGDWRDLEKCGWEDLRIEFAPRGAGQSAYGVLSWDKPSGAVTGNARISASTPAAVADPRIGVNENAHTALYRICRYTDPAGTVTGASRPASGAICIPDPRVINDADYHKHAYRVSRMDEPSGTVTGGGRPSSGSICVADPRLNERSGRYPGLYRISPWTKPGNTVIGHIQSGAPCIQDPRPTCKCNMAMMGVQAWNTPAAAVTGSARPSCGSTPAAIADPRLGHECRSGTFGVIDWREPAATVSGNLDVHAGAAAVADVRIPAQGDAGRWVIIAEDGTWHRPLTTLEQAALQDFPMVIDGKPLQLAGNSEGRWRERVGNAVPVGAAEGMGNAVLDALLANEYHEIMYAAATMEIWVKMLLWKLFKRGA